MQKRKAYFHLSNQYGVRPKLSIIQRHENLHQQCLLAGNNGILNVSILFDIIRAFHTIYHEGLLYKLSLSYKFPLNSSNISSSIENTTYYQGTLLYSIIPKALTSLLFFTSFTHVISRSPHNQKSNFHFTDDTVILMTHRHNIRHKKTQKNISIKSRNVQSEPNEK